MLLNNFVWNLRNKVEADRVQFFRLNTCRYTYTVTGLYACIYKDIYIYEHVYMWRGSKREKNSSIVPFR